MSGNVNLGQTLSVIRIPDRLRLLATGLLLLAAGLGNAQDTSPAETPASPEFRQTLSEPERAWLRAHPVISVAQDPSWPPIEFTDERGTPSGMTADYLRLVEERLGVKFKRVKNLSWQEAYARMKRWEIDLTTSVTMSSEREPFWAFTKPYMTVPIVVVTRSDVAYIADLRELEGKPVAVVEGYVADRWIARDFPDIQRVRVKTTKDALAMLRRGDVFACVENMLVLDYYMAKLKLTDLKISGSSPYNNSQCMAVRKDWAILAGLLDRALDSISATERQAIYRKWLPLHYQSAFDYTRLWPAAAILAMGLMGLGVRTWQLSAEIRHRQQVEAALRASEQEFRSLAEAMPQIVWSTRADGWNIYFNQQWVDYTGLTLEESHGHGWSQPFHPDDQQRALNAWQRATQHHDTYSLECRLRRADGAYRWFLIRGVPLLDAAGTILKWFGTCTDIEDIKRATAEAQREQVLSKTIIDSIPGTFYLLDEQGRYTRWNSYQRDEILGQPEAQMAGLNAIDTIHPEDRAFIQARIANVLQDDKMECVEGRVLLRGGPAFIWMLMTGRRMMIAGRPFLVGTGIDITERKQAEEALRQKAEALCASNAELEQFNRAMVGRENRMIELKRELNELCRQLDLPPRYTAPEHVTPEGNPTNP
jgi:PAS domain S-box-containing protein